ncbi:MAG: hypothetical protein LBP94_04475 [Zoogloeaceae bacterium]|jgi:hypothetical protein|nr:hypothetical protein [Zoogloeaceae bacterium]
MKKTKQKKLKLSRRNTLAINPIMKKGGPHQRLDKRATRARQKARLRRESESE